MANVQTFLKSLLTLLLYAALMVVALVLLANNSHFQQNGILRVVRASQYGLWKQQAEWKSFVSLKRTNEDLALENTRLRAKLARLQEQQQVWEAESVTPLFQVDSFAFIPAQVVNNSINRQQNFLIINKGASEGVEPDMGVICDNGIVGIVNHVSNHYSLVISLLNTDQRFSAILQPSGTFGTLQWNGNDYKRVVLSEIPLHIDVAKGDTVVSSHFSALFPPYIPIGTVEDSHLKKGTFLDLTVHLFTDFKRIKYVNVVKHQGAPEIEDLTHLAEEEEE